jgi:rubrerythrin
MNCVHGTRADKPCPDCEWETEQRRKGIIAHVSPPKPKPGWMCPRCGGSGHNSDGSGSYGMRADGATVSTYKPPSKCFLCKGKGRVNVTALPESDE